MGTPDTIGVSAAAGVLRMTRRGVLAAIKRGALPAERLGTGRSPYVLQRADVEALASERAR